MTTPLIRARRLVWFRHSDDSYCDEPTMKYRCKRFDGVWTAYLPDGGSEDFTTLEEARSHLQDIFDSFWRADTEVMPLEWERHPNIRDFKQSGIYRVAWSNPNRWQLFIDRNDSSVHSTEQEATDAANAHNRKTLLGE